MVATGSPAPSTRAISEPSDSSPAFSSSAERVMGRLQARPLSRRMSSTTPSYSSRSMKPSSGLKTPVEIICRSDRARGLNGTLGSPAASIDRSLRSSSGTTRSMSSPPCGAIWLSVLSKIFSFSCSRCLRRYFPIAAPRMGSRARPARSSRVNRTRTRPPTPRAAWGPAVRPALCPCCSRHQRATPPSCPIS